MKYFHSEQFQYDVREFVKILCKHLDTDYETLVSSKKKPFYLIQQDRGFILNVLIDLYGCHLSRLTKVFNKKDHKTLSNCHQVFKDRYSYSIIIQGRYEQFFNKILPEYQKEKEVLRKRLYEYEMKHIEGIKTNGRNYKCSVSHKKYWKEKEEDIVRIYG